MNDQTLEGHEERSGVRRMEGMTSFDPCLMMKACSYLFAYSKIYDKRLDSIAVMSTMQDLNDGYDVNNEQ